MTITLVPVFFHARYAGLGLDQVLPSKLVHPQASPPPPDENRALCFRSSTFRLLQLRQALPGLFVEMLLDFFEVVSAWAAFRTTVRSSVVSSDSCVTREKDKHPRTSQEMCRQVPRCDAVHFSSSVHLHVVIILEGGVTSSLTTLREKT